MLNPSARLLRAAAGATALVVSLMPPALHASSPKFFQATTQAEFLKGDLENLSVDDQGQLVLGPGTDMVYETSAPFLWAMLAAPDGSLYVGTGNEGQVFKIDPQGKGSLFFDSAELEVHALAPAPNGGLYVGTSPDGKIYRLDRNGVATEFFDPEDRYIWALTVDGQGNVYAATGEKGAIYKIAPDGKGAVFYRTNTTHATAIVFDKAGNLLVGTGSPGKVLRLDPQGKPFVLLDSPFQEIRTLRFDDKGVLYAAAISGRPATGGSSAIDIQLPDRSPAEPRPLVASVSAEITSIAVIDTSGASSSAAPRDDRRLKGGVYRIAPDGVWDLLWESRDDSPYDLAFDRGGAVIVDTGGKGKIYVLGARAEGGALRAALLARASAQQVTAFYQDPRGRLYYATANPGKVFRLSSDRASRGTYESEARDAQMVSTWGAINWRGAAPGASHVDLFTRSGNTETPDEAWSPWVAAGTSPLGAPISSPKARYLQWRAVLTAAPASTGEGPILTSVTAAYLQRNLRPQVRSITVHPPGIVFQKPFSAGEPDLAGFDDQTNPDRKLAVAAANTSASTTPALGRRAYQKGLRTLIWKADDENDDELVYDVLYRREGEKTWKALHRGHTDSILVWDTTSVPNGTYFVRVVAVDSPSNPTGVALAGDLDSAAFEIDNTPPQIVIGRVRLDGARTIVAFDVKDDHSPVAHVEFSQNGQQWRGAFPKDGMADSREEQYELVIDGALGERGLTLRASDSMGNVATAHVDPPASRSESAR